MSSSAALGVALERGALGVLGWVADDHRVAVDLAGVGALVAVEGAVAEVAVLLGDAILVGLALATVLASDAFAGRAGVLQGALIAVFARQGVVAESAGGRLDVAAVVGALVVIVAVLRRT